MYKTVLIQSRTGQMTSKRSGLNGLEGLAADKYSQLGNSLLERESEELSTQLSVFQSALSNFAKEHGEEIRKDPEFRSKFAQMCASIGVDPLAISNSGGTGPGANKLSFWGNILGKEMDVKKNAFYYELAVKVIEICRQTRDSNGGIISVKEVVKRLVESNNSVEVSSEDIIGTVKSLQVLGDGFCVVEINDKKFIRSVAQQLSNDHTKVFEACDIMGFVSVSLLRDNYGWTRYRTKEVLDNMITAGLLWLDDQGDELQYWEPSWINR